MKQVTALAFTLCISFICLYSCGSVNGIAKKITIASGEIPPDMAKEDFIIVGILYKNKKYNKVVEKVFNAHLGKSVAGTFADLTSTYKDIKKYRYYMYSDRKSEGSTYTNDRGGTSHIELDTYRCYIVDRKTGSIYTRKEYSSPLRRELRGYLKAIDAVRKK